MNQAILIEGGPAWLTLPFVLIAAGVVMALLIVIFGARAASRRRAAEQELIDRGEAVASAPSPAAIIEPVAAAPEPATPTPEPATAAPEAAPVVAEPVPVATPAPSPEPAPAAPVTASATGPSDDLTRLKGVGPRLAERLMSVGVTSFAQLAELSPADAAALDAKLGDFRGRIARDRWVEQAQLLAKGDVATFEEKFGKL